MTVGNGTCIAGDAGGICQCNNKTIGEACQYTCINGFSTDSETCTCDLPCITGEYCEQQCNNEGKCNDTTGMCDCHFTSLVSGVKCEEPGCPGEPDCMDHGTCNQGTNECECDAGWSGLGCEVPECNCNSVPAKCEKKEGDTKPRCYDCAYPHIGDNCEKRYRNDPMFGQTV